MAKVTLINLTADQIALEDLISEAAEANNGEISDYDSVFSQWQSENEGGMEKKLAAIASLIREKELRAEAKRAEAKRLTEAARVEENRAKGLLDYAKFCMDNAKIQKHKAGLFEARIQKNGGAAPLIIANQDWFRDHGEFTKVSVENDNSAIRLGVETGVIPPEVAHLGERGTSLRFV
jgi:hypothetical protein